MLILKEVTISYLFFFKNYCKTDEYVCSNTVLGANVYF